MKNNEEKYFDYLHNKMNEREKQSFETELRSSEGLKKDFETYKKIKYLVNESKQVKLNIQYSQTILPMFRKRLEKKKRKVLYYKYGYAFAALFIILFSFSIITRMFDDKQNIHETYTNISGDEASYIAKELNIDFEKSIDDKTVEKIDSVYENKLAEKIDESVNDNNLESISGKIDLKELDQYLTDKDIETLYADLSEKEILQR